MSESTPPVNPSPASDRDTEIVVRQEGEGVTITLGSGDEGNFLGKRELGIITAALDEAEETGKRWALFAHDGRDFCLGRATNAVRSPVREELIGFVERLRTSRLITVSAARGGSVGFGVGVFALADLSFAAEGAWFQFPEILHGMAPAIVATWLYDLVPAKQGLLWTLTGARFDANEAHMFGIASRVMPAERLDGEVSEALALLERLPAEQLIKNKTVAHVMTGMPPDLAARREVALRWFL